MLKSDSDKFSNSNTKKRRLELDVQMMEGDLLRAKRAEEDANIRLKQAQSRKRKIEIEIEELEEDLKKAQDRGKFLKDDLNRAKKRLNVM